jgi:TolB-like protein/Tfp pilus assembly protein PilF
MNVSNNAVFLSYASQDSDAAAALTAALREAGLEVWFDQSELRGGDAWDASIRRQIKACALFIPLISRNTHAREEGYFRLEWKLAVDRSHLMAASRTFLLPVVIDDTRDSDDKVPDRFREVQWTRLSGDRATAAFVERVAKLVQSDTHAAVQQAHQAPLMPGPGSAVAGRSRRRWTLAVLGAGVLGVAGYVGFHRFAGSQTSVAPAPVAGSAVAQAAIPEKSIAVLPFVDMSEKKDQEYFSDGLAEELLDLLGQIRDLKVAARTSSFYFKGKSEDVAAIARQLRVANILEGSVRKSGDVIRVSAQLIRADNGYNLWSRTYDRQIKDIFKVQDEIAGAVVDSLKLQLLPAQQIESRHRTANTEAYTQYLLGNQFRALDTSEANHQALSAYQKAVALDPNFAAGYSGVADAEWRIADQTTNEPGAYTRAMASAEKAIELAPDSPEGYWARGQIRNFYYFDWQSAKLDYEKAIALDPTFTPVHIEYAVVLATLGRMADGIAEIRKVLALDPLSTVGWRRLAWMQLQDGQFDAARASARRVKEVNPNADDRGAAGFAALYAGRPAEAMQAFNKNVSRVSTQGLAMTEYTLGHAEASDRYLAEFMKLGGNAFAYQYVEVYAWRGEKDKAFEWLETAFRSRDGGLGYITYDRSLKKLEADPRYDAFLRKLKLTPG